MASENYDLETSPLTVGEKISFGLTLGGIGK
jgi:hypothetical protein